MSHFFINRPIFAMVLSIIITLTGAIAVFTLPIAQYPEITPPTVQVTANYPGASADVVAETVAAPIEQQVNGVENMLYMYSQASNDGTYTLNVTFKLGVDLNIAQVLVQNRVSTAMPNLPQTVRDQGVVTKKKSPAILLVVNLIAPNGSYDELELSNYATIFVRDELSRLNGVGDVNYLGQRDYSMRLWLEPEKLAEKDLTVLDVANAIKEQNVQVAAGQIGARPIKNLARFSVHDEGARPAQDHRGIRQHHHQDRRGRPNPPHVRHFTGGAGGEKLQLRQSRGRQTVGRPGGLSAPRLQCPGDRGRRQDQDEGTEETLPARHGV